MSGFRKAKDTQAALKIALYGSAGDGKTVTALLIAEGLAQYYGKEVALVDTEYGTAFYTKHIPERSFHPQAFEVSVLDSRSITEISHEIRGLDPHRFGVVILDSITHVWEACPAAYQGKMTKAETIPVWAWNNIKKPWKDLVAYLLSSPMHVILCGREGREYDHDQQTGEMKVVGHKMKAEGDTAYEPHILIRMEGVRDKKTGEKIPTAIVEKDRTGILQGKIIPWPNFDSIARPILPYLGTRQGVIQTQDEIASKDAEELDRVEKEKIARSAGLRQKYERAFSACQKKEEVASLAKQLTPDVKKELLGEDLGAVRAAWEKATEAMKLEENAELKKILKDSDK